MNQRPAVSDTVRRLRAELGLSQAELARRSGLEPNYIAQLEAGRIGRLTVDTLHGLASALGMTLDEAAAEFGYPPTVPAAALAAARGEDAAIERAFRLAAQLPDGPDRHALFLLLRRLPMLVMTMVQAAGAASEEEAGTPPS